MQVPPDLTGLNTAPAADLEQALLDCCAAPRWAAALIAGRPYGPQARCTTRQMRQ